MQVVVNSLITKYQKSGEGPVVVLVHGWANDLGAFAKLQSSLDKDFCVISLDLPGFGSSQVPQTTWDLDDYGRFLADFLIKLEIGEIEALVGHSNGGAICIRGLANGTLNAEKLVLLASSGIRTGKFASKYFFRALSKLGKVVAKPLPAGTRTALRKRLYKVAGSDMLVAEHLQETFKRVISQDVQSDARKLSQPTLLIYGQGDTDTPALFGIRFNRLIANSRLHVLDNADHYLHREQPDAVADLIRDFLK